MAKYGKEAHGLHPTPLLLPQAPFCVEGLTCTRVAHTSRYPLPPNSHPQAPVEVMVSGVHTVTNVHLGGDAHVGPGNRLAAIQGLE